MSILRLVTGSLAVSRCTFALLTAFLTGLLMLACSPNGPEGTPNGDASAGVTSPSVVGAVPGDSVSVSPTTPTRAELSAVDLRLVKVISLKDPVSLAVRPNDSAIYVAQRSGRVWRIAGGRLSGTPLVDLSPEISLQGQGGLFSLTFSPDGSRVYLCYRDLDLALRVEEFSFRDERVVMASRRNVLSVPQLSIRHHGGHMQFGPDGHLWIGLGDGSLGSDPGDMAQSRRTLLGKLVRIDPGGAAGKAYAIPADNPFVGSDSARPEIYVLGLRNPWRFSFDSATGDLWIGDVGQYRMEEIDFLPAGEGAGANFGWSRFEGNLPFTGKAPRDHVPPIFQYDHDDGRCAVIGGHVYRGGEIEGLGGGYVYSDFCDGRIRALVQRDGGFRHGRDLGVRLDGIASFAEGPDSELWVLSLSKGVFRLEPR